MSTPTTDPRIAKKRALFPDQGRRRRYGIYATPIPGPALSDLIICPRCKSAKTGLRTLTDGFVIVTNIPLCLVCAGFRQSFGWAGRRAKTAIPRPMVIAPSIPPEVVMTIHFEEREVRGGPLRRRLAERNLDSWRQAARESRPS